MRALTAINCCIFACSTVFAETSIEVEKRLTADAAYLASDDLEGRGVGTEGLNKAAQFIADQFGKLKLNTDVYSGTPFQTFELTASTNLGAAENNTLKFIGPTKDEGETPQRITLKLEQDFNPLSIGGSGKFDAPLAFVGYGISAEKLKYDDYADVDVKGKVVVMLRKEPQQNNPHSVFDGTNNTHHAYFATKVSNAFQHGAVAVVIVNDAHGVQQTKKNLKKSWQRAVDKLKQEESKFKEIEKPTPEQTAKHEATIEKLAAKVEQEQKARDSAGDKIVGFSGAGRDSSRDSLSVYFATRESIEPAIESAFGRDLTTLEKEIDTDLKPRSAVIDNWRAVGQTEVIRTKAEVKNVIAVLDGRGPLADETVVLGAHYDHLGFGGKGNSLAPWTKAIHNGADDNASGVAVLLEVARRMIQMNDRPQRRVVFIAFTGEERGLLGSARYVREPKFSLSKTVAMVNMDMVGRLKDNKLIVHGTGTADMLDQMIDELNKEHAFKITKSASGFGPSDHSSFYAKKIPVLHLFTGSHKDYHRPSDDVEKLNVSGMNRIGNLVTDIMVRLATDPERPVYKETKRSHVARGGSRPYFGSIPDFSQDAEGYALMGVSKEGPAERAGMKSGDVIIKLGKNKIGNLQDFDTALRKFKGGDKVTVTILREGTEQQVEVTLDPPR